MSSRVQQQLQQRRSRVLASWRNDPARELALLLLGLVCLSSVFVLGAAAKQRWFDRAGLGPDATYWMESAQRFRYVRMVADGEGIPAVDARMQAPDGYEPRTDTILQEELYGELARRFRPEDMSLAAFVRLITRLTSASSVFGLALLAYALTRRRDAALLAAFAFVLALPVAERGSGLTLYREDAAFPAICLHLAFLGFWARRPRWFHALIAGVFLAVALLLWKVTGFYALLLVGFLGTAHWLGREEPRALLVGTVLLFAPSVAAAWLPYSLHHDGWATSTAVLAAGAVAIGMAGGALRRSAPAWSWSIAAAVAFVGLRAALPSEAGYDHAWDTIFARLQHFGHKPSDPSLLTFHARHYWTGNYESPSPALLLRDWPLLGMAAIPGLLLVLRWWRPTFWREWSAPTLLRPPPTGILEGWGPSSPLLGLASHLVLWLVGAFGAAYLLFRKLQLFAAVPLVVLVAIAFAAAKGEARRWRRGSLVALVLASSLQGWGVLPTFERWLPSQVEDADAWNPVAVFSDPSFNGLAEALPGLVGVDEPVLASFVISPFLLTYLDRPTVLHCFFEGDVLQRYEEITLARFGDEQGLWEVASRYGARWYLHEAHHLLRTDGRMSQRYVAAAMDWPGDSALARMSYAPEELKHFELAWENEWFRLYRVLGEGERPKRPAPSGLPAWSRPLFARLFGDPLGPIEADRYTPADLLYGTLKGEQLLLGAIGAVERADGLSPWNERELQQVMQVAPWLWKADQILEQYYVQDRQPERARRHGQRARAMQRALRGEGPFPDDLAPVPVRRVGD
jgi:hypothetical protein